MLAHLIITQATKACGWGRIAYTRYAHLSNRRGEQKKRKLVKKKLQLRIEVEAILSISTVVNDKFFGAYTYICTSTVPTFKKPNAHCIYCLP